MRDEVVMRTILETLSRLDTSLREQTLCREVEIGADRLLTRSEFADAIGELLDRGLVERDKNLMGDTTWSITVAGKAAAKGV